MALQLRRLLPHGCAHRAVTHALAPPPAPAMLQFLMSQRYPCTSLPFSPFRPCQLHGVSFRSNSAGQISSRMSTKLALQLKDKRLRFLVKSKSPYGNSSMRREDGTVAHNLFHRSERRQSTLAACSTTTDEALTSTSNSSTGVANAKRDTAKRKSSKSSTSIKKEVNVDVEEKKAPAKKNSKPAKTSKTVAKTTEEINTNQEDKKAGSKSKKGTDSSKGKKVNNKSKSNAKNSAVPAKAQVSLKTSVDGSGSERKPLVPLYPPTAKSVVVVESVTKAKVIQNYLGDMYEVLPSYGHVRDLAGKSRSVRPDDDFSMVWEVPAAAWTHLKSIKVALKGTLGLPFASSSDLWVYLLHCLILNFRYKVVTAFEAQNLILASDPDREGEAIAWHIKEMLEQQDALGCNVTVARVVFHEITEDAIKKALVSPRYIDMNLVNAYLARRSLDYLIGFGISPLLWRKLPGCQSAGRVQSAALALVCDRETEIEMFKPQEYWTVQTDFKTQYVEPSEGTCIPSRIKHLNSKKLDQLSIRSQEEAQAIEKRIHSSQFEVIGVKRSNIHKNPPMPYITSSLQQDAANKLHFTAGYTMKVAQKLYEGISLSSEETTGLITYIRTDGFHVSDGAVEDIRSLVKERYGQEYASEDIRKYLKKVKNAQEAHEAIRPTSIRRLPSSLVGILDDDALKLYTLIWKRTMACQMEASRTEMIQVEIGTPEGDMIFHASASKRDFKGYQAVYEDTEASPSIDNSEGDALHDDNFEVLSKLEVKDLVSPVNVHLAQHFTKPPSRYSEGALIKKLEELGIGRPSTYASIMKVLQDRNYVTTKSRVLHPEFRGRMVSAFLLQHFSEVADLSFTANMETELDNVSSGSTEWKGLMKDYWERFSKYCADAGQLDVRKVERMLEEKFSSILFPDLDEDSRSCPSCAEGTLRFKVSRYGEGYFIGCDRHPKCKYIARTMSQEDEDEVTEETQRSFTPRLLGVMPDSDEKVFLKQGPYGYYVQVGEDRKGLSPKRASLSEVKDVDSVTIEDAIEVLQYPKILGQHPDDQHPVIMTHSKAGFNVKHRTCLAPVPKNTDPKEITLERALKLLGGKNVKKFGRPKGKSVRKEPLEWH
ncbi:hypothetical protein ACP4OV_001589 [Aristida adscensionis]